MEGRLRRSPTLSFGPSGDGDTILKASAELEPLAEFEEANGVHRVTHVCFVLEAYIKTDGLGKATKFWRVKYALPDETPPAYPNNAPRVTDHQKTELFAKLLTYDGVREQVLHLLSLNYEVCPIHSTDIVSD